MFEYNPGPASTSAASYAQGNKNMMSLLMTMLSGMGKGDAAGTPPAGTTTTANASYAPGVQPSPWTDAAYNITGPKSSLSY